MAAIAVAFPVQPGKTEAGRQFAREALARGAELAAFFDRIGVTEEHWYLQRTPAGDQVIVYFEADDPVAVFTRWAASNEPFDRWFREQAEGVTGLDFGGTPELPEPIFHWRG